MSDDYFVAEGALKLKGGTHKKKKKKSTDKDKSKEVSSSHSQHHSSDDEATSSSKAQAERVVKVTMTKAERSFKKMQEKKRLERIMEKASKSHRQRVEEFNAKLDNLSEHYDIPKVSWTK